MTVLAVFSYGTVAFGPMIALFFATVFTHAHEVLILMSSAFFWLVSMLLTSIIWIVTGAGSGNPLHDLPALALPVSVALQELFRWLLYRLLRRADKVLEIVSDDKSPLRRHKFAYVGGLGFGMIAGVVAFANTLRESGGPGIVGVSEGGSQYFVLSAAFATNAIIILHICWGVLFFAGFDQIKLSGWPDFYIGLIKVFVVIATHMLISSLSFLNYGHTSAIFLVITYIIAVLLVGAALQTAGVKPLSLHKLFLSKCSSS